MPHAQARTGPRPSLVSRLRRVLPRGAALSLAFAFLLGAAEKPPAPEPPYNGFSVGNLLVPKEYVVVGGPRDGIKSVDAPKFAAIEDVTWLAPQNPVLGVALGGEAHVYPVHLMEYHQIVNDSLGGVPVALTYDPIAGTPLAFERKQGDRTLSFGVSGLLYNANFLLYDRETESLWSQFEGRAVAGPLAGKTLVRVTVRQETAATWIEREPGSVVLERPLPKKIDYRYSPFTRYWVANTIPYPVRAKDTRFHAKEVVVGVVVAGKARAYLGSKVTAAGGHLVDEFEGARIQISYDPNTAVFVWDVPAGVELTEAYWFAWKAFHPDTEVWEPPGS